MNEYEQQANDFLKSVNASIKIEWVEYALYFNDDDEPRNVYKVRIRRKPYSNLQHTAQFTFTFKANLMGDTPTAYDILACLTKGDPGTFEDFCWGYGYDTDSRKAERIYKAVCKEWRNVERVFGDCLDGLREIQ